MNTRPNLSSLPRETLAITHTPDPHPGNGFTRSELEREAAKWADEHGLLDYVIVICDDLPKRVAV